MRALVFCVFLFWANASSAAVVTVQAFDFGEWILKNNNAQHEITVNVNGSYAFDSAGFIEISPPQPGIYDIDGLTPSTAISSVDITRISVLSGTGPWFDIINLQESHSATTDAGGVARVTVGGTAQTSGSGALYADQTFNGVVQIQINF